MLKIGITGGIGSGKSTVCRIFEQLGVPVYYADPAARHLMESNTVLREKLISEFGPQLFDQGKLQTKTLAAIVFNNEQKLAKLNNLVHPAVQTDFDAWALKQSEFPYVIKEAALMFESGSNKTLDAVIFVKCPMEQRIERVMLRDNLSREEIMKRINKQWPDEMKEKLSDEVIINDGSSSVIEQVIKLHVKWTDK